MAVTEQQVQEALKQLVDPNTRKDYVSSKSARNIRVEGDNVSVDVLLGYPAKSQIEPIRRDIASKLKGLPGIGSVTVNTSMKIVSHAVQRGVNLVPGSNAAEFRMFGQEIDEHVDRYAMAQEWWDVISRIWAGSFTHSRLSGTPRSRSVNTARLTA